MSLDPLGCTDRIIPIESQSVHNDFTTSDWHLPIRNLDLRWMKPTRCWLEGGAQRVMDCGWREVDYGSLDVINLQNHHLNRWLTFPRALTLHIQSHGALWSSLFLSLFCEETLRLASSTSMTTIVLFFFMNPSWGPMRNVRYWKHFVSHTYVKEVFVVCQKKFKRRYVSCVFPG